MGIAGELAVALIIFVGLIGVVIPLLPGTILVAAAILVWAIVVGGWAWLVFAVAVACMAIAWLVKYVVGGRSMTEAGVHRNSLIAGGMAGIVGFFVIPVIGLIIGFVGGTFAAEATRLRDARAGWNGAIAATKAAGLILLIELAGALFASGAWLVGAIAL